MLFHLHNGRITEGDRKGDKVCDKNLIRARPTSLNFTCITEGERKGNGRDVKSVRHRCVGMFIKSYIYIYIYHPAKPIRVRGQIV